MTLRRNPKFWGRAGAGILFFSGNSVLLVKRSSSVREPLTWGVPGGSVSGEGSFESEDLPEQILPERQYWRGALREVEEELGSIPEGPQPFDKVVFKNHGFTYVTFCVRIPEASKSKWKIELNWENEDAAWFPVNHLPKNLHPGVEFVISQKPELFDIPSDLTVKWISDEDWKNVFILPRGSVLWHGSPKPYIDEIEKLGHLRNDMWSRDKQEHKTSRGVLFEEGLIWLFTSITPSLASANVKEEAERYARGRETYRPTEAGGILEIETPKDYKICYRYKPLTEEEITTLKQIKSHAQLFPGMELDSAVYRLFMADHNLTYKEVLPLLGFDGISYKGSQIGLAVNKLPIRSVTKIS